jgi:hypothetical protein
VARVGRLEETSDPFEPYRLVDPDGLVVVPVIVYLRDLQAAGRSAATQRSYGMDLLRWFRFLWAVEVPWNIRLGQGQVLGAAESGHGQVVAGSEVRVDDGGSRGDRAARLL